MTRTVFFEDTGEERELKGFCSVCYPEAPLTWRDVDIDIVSPSGTVHALGGWGNTVCGRDATGESWWWRG